MIRALLSLDGGVDGGASEVAAASRGIVRSLSLINRKMAEYRPVYQADKSGGD